MLRVLAQSVVGQRSRFRPRGDAQLSEQVQPKRLPDKQDGSGNSVTEISAPFHAAAQ